MEHLLVRMHAHVIWTSNFTPRISFLSQKQDFLEKCPTMSDYLGVRMSVLSLIPAYTLYCC